MTDTGIAGGLRETLEQGQRKATTCQTVPWFSSEEKYHNAFLALEDAITSALAQLEALERDHEAMEKLRKTSKSTHTWQFMGGLLLQVDKQNIRRIKPGYVDPARAILGPGDSNG